MPEDPRDEIKDRFAAEYDDEAEEPTSEAALSVATKEIVERRQHAAGLFAELKNLVLTEEQRNALSGKRVPDLDHIAESLGAALSRRGDIEQALGFTGRHLGEGALADRAAGGVVMAGQRLSQGGDNGSLLCAATMDALCERALNMARALLADAGLGAEQRSDLEIAFSEPFRLQKAAWARRQAESDKLLSVARGPLAQIDKAEEAAQATRLIDGFLTAVKQTRGDA